MTLFEVMIYGPFFCLVFSGAGAVMLEVTELLPERPWLGKIAIAVAFVIATGATWAVGNMAGVGEAGEYRDYPEPPPIDYGRFNRQAGLNRGRRAHCVSLKARVAAS